MKLYNWSLASQTTIGDHANDILIDDIQTFDGKKELYLDQILKLENIATVKSETLQTKL